MLGKREEIIKDNSKISKREGEKEIMRGTEYNSVLYNAEYEIPEVDPVQTTNIEDRKSVV